MSQLEGKLALVTGAGHRVGRAIALALADAGCDLLVHYHRSGQLAEQTAKQAEQLGVRAVTAQADLSRSEGVAALFGLVDTELGGLDVLVNSAAVLHQVDLLEFTEQNWRDSVGLNLKGAAFCLQQAALRMRARGSGAIVNISDTAAQQPWQRFPLHSISKAGLEMLTRVAAFALAPEIRVNAVVPGPTLKPPWMSEQRWAEIIGHMPLRRAVEPEDVAQAVEFLLTNQYVTGHVLRVDGGTLL